ncbi:TPA: type I toxin-antitoxin system Ibs family toxin [Kluyvera intermedia]|nr:type I toxin-antitoxin system Ibs family toxin [Kluyvera intermedia]
MMKHVIILVILLVMSRSAY